MALTITWNEYNGSAETQSAGITAINFASKDASGLVTPDFPIRSGSNSFGKYIKANFADFVSEGVSTVSLAKIHIINYSPKTGHILSYNGLGQFAYAKPDTASLADSAIPLTLPGAQNVALGGSDAGTLAADGESDYFRLQLRAAVDAVTGAIDSGTLTLTYTVA